MAQARGDESHAIVTEGFRAGAPRATHGAVKSVPTESADWSAEYAALETRVLAALRTDLSEAEFNALALDVHAFQRRWNEPYGKFCATRPEPESWREVPAVPQSTFKRHRLSVASSDAIAKTFRTSGTTGEGFGEHHFVNTRLYEAAVVAGWQRLDLPRDAWPMILAPSPAEAPHSSLAHMFGTLAGDGLFLLEADGSLDIGRFMAATRTRFDAKRPIALLGTALAFLNVFERLGPLRPQRRPKSFAMETGGYKGSGRDVPKAELYAMFGQYLDLAPDRVLNEYGMTELSSQFYTRGLGAVHEAGPWLRALVIDPESGREVAIGEMGVLRIFDLANLGSALAIETQDIAIRRERGFELIGRDPGAIPRGCSRPADERMRA